MKGGERSAIKNSVYGYKSAYQTLVKQMANGWALMKLSTLMELAQ